jgi:hypothetical protein
MAAGAGVGRNWIEAVDLAIGDDCLVSPSLLSCILRFEGVPTAEARQIGECLSRPEFRLRKNTSANRRACFESCSNEIIGALVRVNDGAVRVRLSSGATCLTKQILKVVMQHSKSLPTSVTAAFLSQLTSLYNDDGDRITIGRVIQNQPAPHPAPTGTAAPVVAPFQAPAPIVPPVHTQTLTPIPAPTPTPVLRAIMPSNSWHDFRKQNKGKGWSLQRMSAEYRAYQAQQQQQQQVQALPAPALAPVIVTGPAVAPPAAPAVVTAPAAPAARSVNAWNEFQKRNAGKGWSRQRMSQEYQAQK